jgi:hypothetical protein
LSAVLRKISWVVYAKRPFGGPAHVFRYLGQYTHRVGLTNSRICNVADNGITFTTRGEKTVTLEPFELIRRFLQHVLPSGFVKIRHYGLCASVNAASKLATAQTLLGPPATLGADKQPEPETSSSAEVTAQGMLEIVLEVFANGQATSPACGKGDLQLQQAPATCATGPPQC